MSPKERASKPRRRATPEAEQRAALERRAAEAQEIVDFVDRTSLGGDEEAVTGELTTVDQHPADTSDMTFQRELDLTARTIAESRLSQVAEALERQRAGTYGICDNCGRPIDPERLRARPEATLCIDCQRNQESDPAHR